jgi:hypothetical protein
MLISAGFCTKFRLRRLMENLSSDQRLVTLVIYRRAFHSPLQELAKGILTLVKPRGITYV